MTLQFGVGVGVLSYRAFRQAWVGCLNLPPAVVAEVEDGKTVVYDGMGPRNTTVGPYIVETMQ